MVRLKVVRLLEGVTSCVDEAESMTQFAAAGGISVSNQP
jgi:hypothetical protein